MPGGISNPVVGYITFTAVKLVGYSIAGLFLNNRYANSNSNFGLVGLVRTVIGIVFGGLLGLTSSVLSDGGVGFYVYFFGLIPVRLLEWWIIIWLFYDRPLQTKPKNWFYAGLGTAWSFILDIPALVGFIATAGVWIC